MHINKLKELKTLLSNSKINYSDAYEVIKSMPPAWSTKEWKEKADQLRRDHCEMCGTNVGIMVLQHTKHPTKFNIIKQKIGLKLLEEHFGCPDAYFEKEFEIELKERLKTKYIYKDACPICGITTIRERKTMEPKYVCSFNHSFDKKVKLKYYKDIQVTTEERAEVKYRKNFNTYKHFKLLRFIKKHDSEIGRQALILAIEESLLYLDMKEIKTACKKCAFKEDFHIS